VEGAVQKNNEELVRGTVDALILKSLSWGPRHGYSVAEWIRATSGHTLLVEDRALYLALHRLEDREWIEGEWGVSDNNRRARYYRLTRTGRTQLRAETARLSRYVEALFSVLHAKEWGA
jgi:transcriptional regulator